jgi:hypothetical protein
MKTIQLTVLMAGLSLLTLNSEAQPSFLTNGLVAYYPFNGNANDASGNGNNGVVLAGASFVADRFGVAASALRIPFGAMMTAPLSYIIEPTNAFTISVWANLSLLSGNYPTIARLNYNCPSFSSLIRFDSVNLQKFVGIVGINCTDAQANIAIPQSPQTNYWYYLTLTFDNGFLSLYEDGLLIGQTNYIPSAPYSVSPDSLLIGQTNLANYEIFDGIVDDLRIYNRALSPSEVSQLYAIESGFLSIQKAVYVNTVNLFVGSNYQVQVSSDLINWTNYGDVFTATNNYWQSTNYWQVSNWNQLFFRLLPQ